MELEMKVTKSVEAVSLRCQLPVNYEEEDMPNDYPHRKNDMWDITIDLATGQIKDWPAGVPAREIDMKVVDEGVYTLLAPDGSVVAEIENDYVPDCIPGRYGDYVEFQIDDKGVITNFDGDADEFQAAFIDEE